VCLQNVLQWCNSPVPLCSKQTHLGNVPRLSKVVVSSPHLDYDQPRSSSKFPSTLCSHHDYQTMSTAHYNRYESHYCLFDELVIVHEFLHNL
jgi:hypothetical protein